MWLELKEKIDAMERCGTICMLGDKIQPSRLRPVDFL